MLGRSVIMITAFEEFNIKQSISVCVIVKQIHYLMINVRTKVRISDNEDVTKLPKGLQLELYVTYHDNTGIPFTATTSELKIRTNRFDLSHVRRGADNTTVLVDLLHRGTTLLKLWDEMTPHHTGDYMKLPVGEVIFPVQDHLVVNELVCFSSPLVTLDGQHGTWESDNPTILPLDPILGYGKARMPGTATVYHLLAGSRVGGVEIQVLPIHACKLAFCKTIADECQPFLQRFQTSKPMTPYLFEAVEKLLRYLMNRCVKPDLMKCTGPKLLSIDTKKSENLILSKNIDIGFATKRLLGETAITVTERQKLEFIHECRSMLTTMIAKLQEKSPLKQKAVRGLSSLDPCVIQHSPQLAQKRFSFLLEELNHANIINDVLAENAKKEYLHFCNLKKSELQEIFRPCDQFSDEVGLDTIYGSFLIGEANYKHLWEVIKICLVLSHGNATVEGGFSVNKSLLVENMHEKTVIAQRHIHDEIQEAGGIKNIHISKKMLDYVRGARKRYHEYLEMKKQEKSEKDKKKAEKRKLDIQVKDLEGERKKLMMATEEKREAIDVELQELKKKQASLY
uniref:Uncharacterized protein n=1 Tax=Timema cristinae TaxID=61476 RepID=A0A7R9GS14_TIMCR|nr:unnamed protein product [Timema cristinae]